MTLAHWLKLVVILFYLGILALVLSWCHTPAPTPNTSAPPAKPAPAVPPKPPPSLEQQTATEAKRLIDQRASERLKQQQARDQALALARGRYLALEAELAALRQRDIPAALSELATAANRYRVKAPDLARLPTAEQWQREAPVKDALARAQKLVADYSDGDKEAQKGRDLPTPQPAKTVETFGKRLTQFRGEGEGAAEFAASIPPLLGSIPQALVSDAIDAIAKSVLPADAFDPCRDPARCPKPAPPPKAAPAPPPAAAPIARVTYCADSAVLRSRGLFLYDKEHLRTRVALIEPGTCGITGTGRENSFGSPEAWVEVTYQGITGWARAALLKRTTAELPPGLFGRLDPAAASLIQPRPPPAGPRYCSDRHLPLRTQPDPFSPALTSIPSRTCGLISTGRRSVNRYGPAAPAIWLEIQYRGHTGWVAAYFLTEFR